MAMKKGQKKKFKQTLFHLGSIIDSVRKYKYKVLKVPKQKKIRCKKCGRWLSPRAFWIVNKETGARSDICRFCREVISKIIVLKRLFNMEKETQELMVGAQNYCILCNTLAHHKAAKRFNKGIRTAFLICPSCFELIILPLLKAHKVIPEELSLVYGVSTYCSELDERGQWKHYWKEVGWIPPDEVDVDEVVMF